MMPWPVRGGAASGRRQGAADGFSRLRAEHQPAAGLLPTQPWLPQAVGGEVEPGDGDEAAAFGNSERLAIAGSAAGQRPAAQGTVAEKRQNCLGQRSGEHGLAVRISGSQAGAMIGFEGAQAAATLPSCLVFPYRAVRQRRGSVGQRGNLGIEGAQARVATDQRIGRILRPGAVGLPLFKRRGHGRLGRRRATNAEHQQP